MFCESIHAYTSDKKKFKQAYILLNDFWNLLEFCINILYLFLKFRIFNQSNCTLIVGWENY